MTDDEIEAATSAPTETPSRLQLAERGLEAAQREIAVLKLALGEARAAQVLAEARQKEIAQDLATLRGETEAMLWALAAIRTETTAARAELQARFERELSELEARLEGRLSGLETKLAERSSELRRAAEPRPRAERPSRSPFDVSSPRREGPSRSPFDVPARPSLSEEDAAEARRRAVLADWGLGPKRPQPAAATRAAEVEPGAGAEPPRLRPSATPEPRREPPRPPAPPPAGSGPTVLDVLASDQTITDGQRQTIRSVYQRFVPGVVEDPAARVPEGATVADVLDSDPYLQRGQREAIRTMYDSFGTHKRQKP